MRCQVDPKRGIVKKLRANIDLVFQFLKSTKDFSHIIVLGSFYSVFIAWVLGLLYSKKIVLKVVVSPYVTQVERRKTVEKESFRARTLLWREKIIYKFPDFILASTQELAERWGTLFSIPDNKLLVLPVGGIRKDINDGEESNKNNNEGFNVLYWGDFLPQHGVEYILKAAKLLKNKPEIKFTLVGFGFLHEEAKNLSRELRLERVEFTGRISDEKLERQIREADVVLGFFGSTKNSTPAVGIGNKTFEGLAMKKPIITEASIPVKRFFSHKKEMYLVDPGNPRAIADAILELYNNPNLRKNMAEASYELFLNKFSEDKIGAELINLLTSL